MKLVFIWFVLFSISCCFSAENNDCIKVLSDYGVSARFGGNVGHSIHSLTLEYLRWFKPDITSNNTIPTIDMNLRAEDAIRPNTLEDPDPSPFMTNSLRSLDRVLSHMDNQLYDVKYFTILERIVHAFHMQEVWEMAQQPYQAYKATPPPDAVCTCARDVESNGVMKMLRFSALAMREPALIYGKSRKDYYVQYQVVYSFGSNDKISAQAPLGPGQVLLTESGAMPPLENEASWKKWKDILISMDPTVPTDLALYLYCNLN